MTRHPDHDRTAFRLAEGLGWFSIGLGLTELLAARPLARALGMEEKTELFRAYGARELATGVGILTQRDPTPWIWGRVGGDVLDLATLATGLGDNPRAGNVGLAIAKLGGYLARVRDPPPGNMVVWRGLTRLMDIHLGFELSGRVVGN